MNDRRGTYSGQRRQLSDRRKHDRVRVGVAVAPAHLEALDNYLVMLDASIERGLAKNKHVREKAAAGDAAAIRYVEQARAIRRYIGDLSNAIAVAREHQFSNEPNAEGTDAKDKT